jgi:hypothetical protein
LLLALSGTLRLTPDISGQPEDADQGGGGDQKAHHCGDHPDTETDVPPELFQGITILGPIRTMISSGRFAHRGTG